MEIPDKILERLEKLIALNERPGSIGEAANSTTAINNLLLKYNLSMTDAEKKIQDFKSKGDFSNIIYLNGKYRDYQTQYDGGFVKSLMETMSSFNFCKMVNIKSFDEKGKNRNFGFTVLGKKHNLDVCMYMFDYCLNNIKILFDEYYVEYELSYHFKKGSGKYYVHRRGFYEGAVIAIHNRLAEQREKTVDEYEPKPKNNNFEDDDFDVKDADVPETPNDENENENPDNLNQLPPSGENALMVMLKQNEEDLEQAAADLLGELKKGKRSKGTSDAEAKYFGHKAGQQLNLLQGLNAGEDVERLGSKLLN